MRRDLPVFFHSVSAQEEQDWNEAQLASPVQQAGCRLWHYEQPEVVLGCAQHAMLHEPSDGAINKVLRKAGGGAVLVGPWMLSASVVLPNSHPLATNSPVSSYRWLGQCFADVLHRKGIKADAITPEATRAFRQANDLGKELSWACYGDLSPWEVVVGQRKLVGLAQVRRSTGTLLVAGLLLRRPDWPVLCQAMQRPTTLAYHLSARTTSLAEETSCALDLFDIGPPLAAALNDALLGVAQ
jgi:lipoate-protein ligase A